jgi:2-keto-4-pentenoate hydratase/2-oxohepta-3-ene-1,7-dioic acid hydratase in catechol pathway
MRIARIQTNEGAVVAREVAKDEFRALAPPGVTLNDLLRSGAEFIDGDPVRGSRLAPLVPGKIVAIGLNYLDHIREAGVSRPESPLVFTKFSSSVIGAGDYIDVDRAVAQRVDWEVELAAVIGCTTRRVNEADALASVFGYTVANDVSARDVQFRDGQWVRGKSMDTFCPLGPLVVTADEIGDPQRLRLGTSVNGRSMQDSSTSEMLFDVAQLIAFCSQNFTLEPGDVVLTGTPWGCGEFMEPPVSLIHGDVVEVWVEGIGSLVNEVRDFVSPSSVGSHVG